MTDNIPPVPPANTNANLPVPASASPLAAPIAGAFGRPPSGPPQVELGDPERIPWGRYLEALKRRWWIVVLAGAAGYGAGTYVAGNTLPVYSASAQIWVGGGTRRSGPTTAGQVLTQSSWERLMRDPSVVEPVVAALRLNVWPWDPRDEPLFQHFVLDSVFSPGDYELIVDSTGRTFALTRTAPEGAPVINGAVGDSIGRSFGFLWAPGAPLLTPRREVRFNVSTVRAAAVSLTGRLRTSLPPEDGQFLAMTLTGDEPRRVARTLNAWADTFIVKANELTRAELRLKREVLERSERLAFADYTATQQTLKDYRLNAALLPSDLTPTGGGIVTSARTEAALAAQRTQLSQTRRDIDALKRIVGTRAADSTIDPNGFVLVRGIVATSTDLTSALQALAAQQEERRRLMGTFTDSAEQVRAVDAQILTLKKTTIPRITQTIIEGMEAVAAQYDSSVAEQEAVLRAIPDRVSEGNRLQAAFASTEALYNQLHRDLELARLAEAQASANLTIMSRAEPSFRPSSNNGPRLFMIAIVVSLGLGIAAALLLDQLDRRFRYPEQATMELGLTIIGTVPRFKVNRRGDLSVSAMSQVVESFRALRLAVRHHFPLDQPVVLCVSSPGAGEGKSLVTANLAIAFANAGHKTLLIDGDVRRGVVHATFEHERRPGLVDYLAGKAATPDILRGTSTENLWIVPSGQRTRTAPELLVSDRVHALVAELRPQFEIIIIDTAPLAAGVDAYALAAAAGTLLVVLRPGVTDRKLAAAKLEVLDRLPVSVIGAVLNGIHGGGSYRYYYSDYSDYAVDGEEDDDRPHQRPESDRPPPRLLSRS